MYRDAFTISYFGFLLLVFARSFGLGESWRPSYTSLAKKK